MADKFQLKAILTAVDKISGPLKNITKATKMTHKSLRDIGNAGGELMRKIGIPAFASFSAITYGAINATKAAIEFAGSVQDAADRTGASLEEYQALSNMLIMTGGSAEDAEMAFTKFNKGVSDGAAGADKNFAGLLNKLGIPLKNAKGELVSLTDALPQLAAGFARNKDPAKQTRMAMELFGKSGTKLIPMMNGLADGSISLEAAMKDVVTAQSIESLDNMGDAIDGLGIKTRNTINNALAKMAPVFQPIIDSMSQWIDANQAFIQTTITETLTEIVNALKQVDWKAVIVSLKETFKTIGEVVTALGGLKGILIGLGLAFIAGPIAAVFSIVGAVFRFGSALVVLAGGWGAIGAAMLKVAAFGKTLLGIFLATGKAILLMGRALLMNPLGLAITALVAGAALIYYNWDRIKQWFVDFGNWIGPHIRRIADVLTGMVPDWVKNLFSGGSPTVNVNAATPAQRQNILSGASNKVNGEMTVKFVDAPPGMRVESAQTSNSGFNLNADTGYRRAIYGF